MTFLSYKYQQTALWLMPILLKFCTPYYDNQYPAVGTFSSSAVKDLILHPNLFNLSYINSFELWNKGYTTTGTNNNTVCKTIQNPSPESYVESAIAAFSGLTSSNVNGAFDKGWTFYCQPSHQGSTIFFRALGYRAYQSGAIACVENGGPYWSSTPSSSYSSAKLLDFYPSYIALYEDPRSFGFPLRPILK